MKSSMGRCYGLSHWSLRHTPEGIAAEGHMHGREGFADGTEIRTSRICQWRADETDIYLYTMNSTYVCGLREYMQGSGSIRLLGELREYGGEGTGYRQGESGTLEAVLKKLQQMRREREAHYAAVFDGNGGRCVLLCWNGCERPYLKHIVSGDGGAVTIEDIQGSSSAITLRLSLFGTDSLIIRPYGTELPDLYCTGSFGGRSYNILLENDGDREFRAYVSGREIAVDAGRIVKVPGEAEWTA